MRTLILRNIVIFILSMVLLAPAQVSAQNPEVECPPTSTNIWVRRDFYGSPLGETLAIPFERGTYPDVDPTDGEGELNNYVAGVLEGELGGTAEVDLHDWLDGTLRAFAVAMRTVAYDWCGMEVRGLDGSLHYGVDDHSRQHYRPGHAQDRGLDYRNISEGTAGQYLSHPNNNNSYFDLQYRDYVGLQTNARTGEEQGGPHKSVPDPVGSANEDAGTGMGQHSANHWMSGQHNAAGCSGSAAIGCNLNPPADWQPNVRWTDYRQLLVHYYTGVHLSNANGAVLTPDYRWNLLSHQTMPTQIAPDQSFQVNLQIQNTGVELWDEDRYAIRYQWCASPLPANCPDYSSDPWPLWRWSQANTLPPFTLGQANSVTASFLAPSSSGTYELVIDICDPVTPAIAPESIMEGEYCFSQQPGQPDWFFYSFPITVGTGGPVPTATTEPTTEPTFTSTPIPTPTATEPPTATAPPTFIATATWPSAQTPSATPSGGGWSLNPIEAVILKGTDAQRTIEYVALLRQVRDEILNATPRGKRFENAYYRHLAELTRLMREDEKLRSRARRLMLQIQPALNEWVEAKGDSQTRVKRQWTRAAQRLVNDLRVKASPELAAELEWWRIQIPKSEGKTLPEIWADLLAAPR